MQEFSDTTRPMHQARSASIESLFFSLGSKLEAVINILQDKRILTGGEVNRETHRIHEEIDSAIFEEAAQDMPKLFR